ncbi:acetylesterase [Companilactobacillus alimentarius DSM 20249]|nr:acetylesterase [Companilactobacillus alimentarius DSM 20249]
MLLFSVFLFHKRGAFMAVISVHYSSQLLNSQTIVRIIMPDNILNKPVPVIWWLHGLGDDGSVWIRKTRLELIATQYKVAVIIPDMQRSFSQNIQGGLPFFDYINKELPEYLHSIFNLSDRRDENFLVGNSMGGYGSYKLSAISPKRFSYVATLSPVTNLKTVTTFMRDFPSIFTSNPESIENLVGLMGKTQNELSNIHWLQLMGADDPLKSDSINFVKETKDKLHINLNQKISPGNHNWTFWDKQLTEIFNWLPLQKVLTGGIIQK